MMVRLTTEQEANIRNSLELSNELKMRSGEFFSVEDVHSLLCEITALREEAKQMCDVDNRHCIDEITSVYAERDDLEKLNNDSVTEFCQKIIESEAREVVLRGTLEKFAVAEAFIGKGWAEIAHKALSSTSPPPLFTGLQIAKETLENIEESTRNYSVIGCPGCECRECLSSNTTASKTLTQLKELGL